jgi:signal recognition particle GTPase
MFDALSERLGGIFDNLTGRGALSEKDVSEALREIRVALLEADVALPVVKDFIAKVKTRAVGEEVIRSVKPGQQVIKIVYDGLVDMLGGEDADTSLRVDSPPAVVMMAGLQGSGKTTTTGKLAQAPVGEGPQESPARLARRAPPGGHGTAGDPGRPVWRECQLPADRAGSAAGGHRPARHERREDRRL